MFWYVLHFVTSRCPFAPFCVGETSGSWSEGEATSSIYSLGGGSVLPALPGDFGAAPETERGQLQGGEALQKPESVCRIWQEKQKMGGRGCEIKLEPEAW